MISARCRRKSAAASTVFNGKLARALAPLAARNGASFASQEENIRATGTAMTCDFSRLCALRRQAT